MNSQMLSDQVYIVFFGFFHFDIFDGLLRTCFDAQGRFSGFAAFQAQVALRREIGDDLGIHHAEGAGDAARLASCAAHVVSLQFAVRLFFQRLKHASHNAGSGLALPADQHSGSPFQECGNAVIIGVIKIAALTLTFFAFVTQFQINKKFLHA
jgi:hypothetical protein